MRDLQTTEPMYKVGCCSAATQIRGVYFRTFYDRREALVESPTDDAELGLLGVAQAASFVRLLAGKAEVGHRPVSVLARNTYGPLSRGSTMSDMDKLGFESPFVLRKLGHDLQEALPVGSPEEIPADVEDQAAKIPDVHGEPRIQLVAKTGVEHLKDEPLF